jgi:RNA polymerase sigma factor (sigma-70 family)
MIRDLGRNPRQTLGDADLLERFVSWRDEAAFELLVWRHERMVRGVCRRLLGREQDVEDAGQATFLTLACKAGAIGQRQALGGWLYKVAFRIALRLKNETAKRGRRERGPDGLDDVPAREAVGGAGEGHDLRAVLDEEVSRLPEKYRTPFILCYLEGKTNEEAATHLGCPTGTVVTWLARARKRLRGRLERRGVTVSASGLAALIATSEVGSASPPEFLQPTVKAALLFARDRTAAGLVSTRVARLTKGALHAMFLDRMKIVAAVALVVCLAGARPGILAYEKLTALDPPANPQANPAPPVVGDRQEKVVIARAIPVPAPLPSPDSLEAQQKEQRKSQDRKPEWEKAEEVITKSFKTGKSPTLVVEVFNGPIEVVADVEGKVDVQVTKRSGARTEEEAKVGLKNVDVQMIEDKEKGQIRVTARRIDTMRRGNEGADVALHVPVEAVLDLRTSNGEVKVTGGKGQVRIRTSNGAIHAKGHKGEVDLNTSNGEIEVFGATGKVELHTNNGAIHIEANKAVVKAHTNNGEARLRGTLADGKHSLTTHNGPVSVTLPPDARFRIDAQTHHGSIVDEFSSGKVKGKGVRRLENTVGDNPQVSLELRTHKGSIEIRKEK